MTLRERIAQWLAGPEKAATGVGVHMMTYGTPLSVFSKDPRKAMQQAQRIGIENLYIRAAERVIGDRFSTIPWHLEDEAGEELTNEVVQRLIERPYIPRPGDPINSTPQTRSALWRLTSRHLGLCGNAFWYLDQTNATGMPLDIIYINPARMTPAEDDNGNLKGWVLDADLPGHGIPLDRREVLHFRLEPADIGHYGIGLVESAFSRAEMLKLADRHANDVLAAGGRLAGLFGPKDSSSGPMPEDQYEQLKRDLRTIAEDPQAGRRALVLKGPVEYTQFSAGPKDLELAAISELGKSGLLELWGVPDSQLGARQASGLNTGESRKHDEATLMQNAVLPRLRAFSEVLQYQLLDRLEPNPQLVVEEPTYDDEAPAYDLLAKAINAPMTGAERRAIIGLEPTGRPEVDDAVMLPISLVAVTGRLSEVTEPQPFKATADDEAGRTIPGVDKVRRQMTETLTDGLLRVLADMKAEIAAKVERNYDHLSRKPSDVSSWWNEEKWERELESVMRPPAALAAQATYDITSAMLERTAKADLREGILARLLRFVGVDIGGILDTTRSKVSKAIEDGIADGLGAAELGRKVGESAGFGEYRAEMIARTETNRILNTSQLETYKEFEVDRVRAIDGDDDAVCAERDGKVFTVAEAATIFDHPNGTLDWVPLAYGA